MKLPRMTLAKIIVNKSGSMPEKKLAKEIAAYVLSEGRTSELDALLRDVMAIRASSGLVEANIESAHELNKNITSEVSRLIKQVDPEAKKVIINYQHNPDLIGGLKISLPDRQLDISLKGKLNKFKQLVSQGVN